MTRSAADIARGLLPARTARPIEPGERIHVLGAAGVGASAAVLLAHHAGASVSGCDAGGPSPYTSALERAGVALAWSHDAAHVARPPGATVDRLAATKALTSVAPDHPELAAAREAGLPVEAWQQLVADAAASQGGRLVGVTGTHGKSTTTGWLVHLLVRAGRDPAAFVGALLDSAVAGGMRATARWGTGDVFLVEADEYAGNFDAYRPSVAVLLNAEWDHPDVFADEEAVIAAFEGWIRAARGGAVQGAGAAPPTLVANAGDPPVGRLLERLGDWPGKLVCFALVDVGADRVGGFARGLRDGYRSALGPAEPLLARLVRSAGGNELELHGFDPLRPIRAEVALTGRHLALDGLAAASAAHVLDVPMSAILDGLRTFQGVGRRLEPKGEPWGVAVLDDYGHHPTAVAANLAALRERFPGRRVWAVYEPLTYHRTAAMLEPFADVLARADRVVIADIWPGRDPDTTITSAQALAAAVRERGGPPATAPGSVEATADHLTGEVERGDVVLVMGGGRSYVIAERLVQELAARERPRERNRARAGGRR